MVCRRSCVSSRAFSVLLHRGLECHGPVSELFAHGPVPGCSFAPQVAPLRPLGEITGVGTLARPRRATPRHPTPHPPHSITPRLTHPTPPPPPSPCHPSPPHHHTHPTPPHRTLAGPEHRSQQLDARQAVRGAVPELGQQGLGLEGLQGLGQQGLGQPRLGRQAMTPSWRTDALVAERRSVARTARVRLLSFAKQTVSASCRVAYIHKHLRVFGNNI